jgi:hypothetical protein
LSYLSCLMNSSHSKPQFTNSTSFPISITAQTSLLAFFSILPSLSLSTSAFFTATLVASALLASTGGFLQTSTITLAPKYGSSAIAAYMSGSALSAVGVSALQVATAYTSTGIELPDMDSASWSATICFMVSATITVLTLVSYRALKSYDHDFNPLISSVDLSVEIPPSERTHLLRQRSQPSLSQTQNTLLEHDKTHYSCYFSILYAGIVTLVRQYFIIISQSFTHILTLIVPLSGYYGCHRTLGYQDRPSCLQCTALSRLQRRRSRRSGSHIRPIPFPDKQDISHHLLPLPHNIYPILPRVQRRWFVRARDRHVRCCLYTRFAAIRLDQRPLHDAVACCCFGGG